VSSLSANQIKQLRLELDAPSFEVTSVNALLMGETCASINLDGASYLAYFNTKTEALTAVIQVTADVIGGSKRRDVANALADAFGKAVSRE
jgi:hypothetical protein